MKREGRQHGMVRTFPILSAPYNPRPNSRRNLNELSSPPTAGLFTKAPSKPTNHSKFTGKCGRPKCRDCHIDPACKSKDKAKGAHKARSPPSDVGGVKVSGLSATGVLDYLDSDDYLDDDECYDDKFSSRAVEIDDDDDKMSFCEVGFVWRSMDGDESWCLVEEKM